MTNFLAKSLTAQIIAIVGGVEHVQHPKLGILRASVRPRQMYNLPNPLEYWEYIHLRILK